MTTVQNVCRFLEEFAPLHLAEEWDNVGLLVGDRQQDVQKIMTCLTITPASVDEAIRDGANLIVTHHPLPFKPLKRLTADSTAGRMLLDLIRARIAVYSPHTAFDSAMQGINQSLAEGLGLQEILPLVPILADKTGLGSGRVGRFRTPTDLGTLVHLVKQFLKLDQLQVVGELEAAVSKVAIACGSAGQFLDPARRAGCDLLLTGETNFHTCLEAEATRTRLILTGHFASERFGVERLADTLQAEFATVQVWASRNERDPLQNA
jgi:dinuclear metal center YbgI/SA1388 family protein